MSRSTGLGTLEIRNLDQLIRKLDPRVFSYANKIVLNRAMLRTRTEARDIVPGTVFDSSIQKALVPGTESGIVYSNAKTADSIHEGRRPGEEVSIRKLRAYIRRYGLASSVSVKTRRPRKATTPETDRAAFVLAMRMQRAIKEKGTKPIPFLQKSLDDLGASTADLARYWRDAIPVALKKFGLTPR